MSAVMTRMLSNAAAGRRAHGTDEFSCLEAAQAVDLMPAAESMTLAGFGENITYSRKVFIPLTQLCRDVCHYCTFAMAPRRVAAPYMAAQQVRAVVRAGMQAGCKEALFTLGDKPEMRYAIARDALRELGATSTIEYLERMAQLVLEESGLLPHLNPGVMDRADLARLRPVSASMGLMLESVSDRLCRRGGPHHGSPDKAPAVRLATLRAAGELGIAMTTGLLIGIGETRRERIESLLALRDIHDEHRHLQELIIQNFRAKAGTKMANAPEPDLEEQRWTICAARLIFGPHMSIQAPPNLQPRGLFDLVRCGVNDWGGVSPVTIDYVNPEAPWPHLDELARSTAAAGRQLVERLALVPAFAQSCERWTDAPIATRVRRLSDAHGHARTDAWYCGSGGAMPPLVEPGGAAGKTGRSSAGAKLADILRAVRDGEELTDDDIVRLFAVNGAHLESVIAAADALRAAAAGETVTYVVNRNINYTNICLYHCGFCAFSKGRGSIDLRGPAYNLDLEEIGRRTIEAARAGATEVCLQGGIHPSFNGQTYLDIVGAVKCAVPNMHVHAFSPLEVKHGAETLELPLAEYLSRLRDAGLSTLPGTAAEILDDEVREIICPDKLSTDEWLRVVRTAHEIGLRTTATIMYGHVERPVHWARHLRRLRHLQAQTGGISEFVPLGFVHMQAPLWRKGRARSGPTFREAVLMHAVSRLVLHPLIVNIQASWVKLGPEGAAVCLQAGANDLGGTLMNESITRAAGGVHGQELDAARLIEIAQGLGRPARQRTTLYGRLPVHEAIGAPSPSMAV